jgi:hypothetical protein
VTSCLELPLDTALNSIAPAVEAAVRPLFIWLADLSTG